MNKKINVVIAGRSYALVTSDEERYVEQIAQQADEMISSVMKQARVPALDAAVLTAVNALDGARRAREAEETLRAQIQTEVERGNKLRQELADARREITRLKKNGAKKS
ncbi:MAG: cell division protein ZapA [Oscillospiraceae bacterium]|nr:cell division protein ZapA [Oscillospiraceae bacterium]